jgi:nucleotide-binding universal stress UspA family protein
MFDRIIVPLDGEPFAEAALSPACELARAFGSTLLLVRAQPSIGRWQGASVVAAEAEGALESLDEADAYLHDVVRQIRTSGCAADLLLYIAKPGEAIAQAAQRSRADLIVMTAHTRWAVQPMSTPSTTLTVLAQSGVPVLAWRPSSTIRTIRDKPSSFENGPLIVQPETPIIVPLDGSLRAERALLVAEALARAFGTYLVLVHAVAPGVQNVRNSVSAGDTRAAIPLVDAVDASKYLDVVRAEIIGRGGHATTAVRNGQPLQVIERCWREFGGSLIVTASRGLTAPQHTVLGSVARRLIEELEAPVLVIPPDQAVTDHSIAQIGVDVEGSPLGSAPS